MDTARSIRRITPLAVIAAALAALAIMVLPATGEPPAISVKRAQVAAIEGQVAALDAAAERATEAYNGARYQLDVVRGRIRANTRALAITNRELEQARGRLARRLVSIYRQGRPTFAEVLLTSGGVSETSDRMDTLERVGRLDQTVVVRVRELRGRRVEQRLALLADRRQAKRHVRAIGRYRLQVERVLAERAAVLRGVRGELATLIAQERARQEAIARAQAAALRAQIARAQAARAAAASRAGTAPATLPQASGGAGPAVSPGAVAPVQSGGVGSPLPSGAAGLGAGAAPGASGGAADASG